MKKGKILGMVCFILGIIAMCPILSGVKAKEPALPTAADNLTSKLKKESALVATGDGYMRVFYANSKINIEYYDNSFNMKSKKTIAMELALWGGFYAGSDGNYYIVQGQNNTAENGAAEVIRVIKYDKNWKRKGAAKITGTSSTFGAEVRFPFDYGCVEMTDYNGTLYVVTGHEGYVDPGVGQGHQGFLMISVNMGNMSGKIVKSDLWHSFAQYINRKGSYLYVLEQSEGSRCTTLNRYNTSNLSSNKISIFKYGGSRTSAWAVACYASVNDMAISSNNVLGLGTSIDQTQYDKVSSKTAHNIYLTVTPTSKYTEKDTKVVWLTNNKDNGKSFLNTQLVKINDNRFMVLWDEYEENQKVNLSDGLSDNVLHYVFIDGNGKKISKEFKAAAPLSACAPILKNSKVVYYASNGNMVDFYAINTFTGEFAKKVYRVAGNNVSWDIKNGVLTISGSGTVNVDSEAHYRYPLSSTRGGYSYSSGDNAWKALKDSVKKIVIAKGVTEISEGSFKYFHNLKEVVIEPGLKKIGKEAFYGCNALTDITIPDTVTSIGEDFLWTGYMWIGSNGHVVRATIHAPAASYAYKYAQKNNISIVETHTTLNTSNTKISGVKASYTYNKKAKKPKVKIIVSGITLKAGKDYKATYGNNVKVGKAYVKIQGIGKYEGSIKKYFNIIPSKVTKLKVKSRKTKTVVLTWKKNPQATGYQIQYSKRSNFKKYTKSVYVKKYKISTKTLKKLTKKKKYYVRIRSYKTVKGKKYYSGWCKAKVIKVK